MYFIGRPLSEVATMQLLGTREGINSHPTLRGQEGDSWAILTLHNMLCSRKSGQLSVRRWTSSTMPYTQLFARQ